MNRREIGIEHRGGLKFDLLPPICAGQRPSTLHAALNGSHFGCSDHPSIDVFLFRFSNLGGVITPIDHSRVIMGENNLISAADFCTLKIVALDSSFSFGAQKMLMVSSGNNRPRITGEES